MTGGVNSNLMLCLLCYFCIYLLLENTELGIKNTFITALKIFKVSILSINRPLILELYSLFDLVSKQA